MLDLDLLRSVSFMEEISDSIGEGINIIDNDGRVVYANQVSAEYANTSKDKMIGKDIGEFYPDAVLLNVLKTKKPMLDKKIHYIGGKRYIVSSYPVVINGNFEGAYSVFRDIREVDELNRTIQSLKLHLGVRKTEEDIQNLIGIDGSLKDVIGNAKRTIGSIGGPRHSIIIGDSGTGKSMLARMIYNYGQEVGTISEEAPFIEVNCAQFTNADIAALEIFGSEEGSFTGSMDKRGLLERANGGVLFLDEAHKLENHQSLLLTAIDTGRFRRIGGSKEISVNVIIIAASTKDLKEELLPELYQRLAQYELYLPPLRERSGEEKLQLLNYFTKNYEEAVKNYHDIKYRVDFTSEAKRLLLSGTYPRNIRQFRDVINYSIDQASPLISDLDGQREIHVTVRSSHLPFTEDEEYEKNLNGNFTNARDESMEEIIDRLAAEGLGPRRISNKLKEYGFDFKYYQVAYYLKKKNLE